MSQATQLHHSSSVLLIGDSCYDRYFFGTCERLSPEAPVPVLKLDRVETRPGMVLNVAANIGALGLTTHVICPSSSITKDRFVDTARMTHLLRVDTGEAAAADRFDPQVLRTVDWDSTKAVVISDYDKGFLSLADLCEIGQWCRCNMVPCFVDTKKRDISSLSGAIVKLNDIENGRLLGRPPEDSCELIVTYGPDGALWRNRWFHQDPVQMFDVCGAGDTFMAGLVVSYVRTGDIPASIEYANRCARVAVQHFGTHVVSATDIT